MKGGELRLDKAIHDSLAGVEHLSKADTDRDQVVTVMDVETPNAARPNVVTSSEAQSDDWLKCHQLCVRTSVLSGKGMLPGKDADEKNSMRERVNTNSSNPPLVIFLALENGLSQLERQAMAHSENIFRLLRRQPYGVKDVKISKARLLRTILIVIT